MTQLLALVVVVAAVPAPVTRAVLYGNQARLTRSSEVAVDGRTRVELPLLPAEADAASVRVEVSGAQLETVEVARLGPESLRVDEARAVVRAIETIDDDLALAVAEAGALGEVGQRGDVAPEVPDDEIAVWGKIDPGRWRQTLGFLRTWRGRLDERHAAADSRVRVLRDRRDALARQAAVLAAGDGGRVRVVVHLSGHGRARVHTSYLLAGPTWIPRYEIRLDPSGDVVDVALAALTAQQTGEDWNRAALAFSTATPTDTLAYPELRRWTIGERDRFIPATVVPAPAREEAPAISPAPSAETAALREKLRTFRTSSHDEVFSQIVGTIGGRVSTRVRGGMATQEMQTTGTGAAGSGIVGYVFDQNGSPIKGVKVVVSSPRLVGGPKAAYSNDEGAFAFHWLNEGTYELRATAPKLHTVIQRGIFVGAQPAEATVVMEVESAGVEEVKIVERAPLVSTTAASVKEVYRQDYDDFVTASMPSSARAAAQTISLAPPEGNAPRPRLAPGQPAALAASHTLSFEALVPETLLSGAMAQPVPLASWRWRASVRRQLYPAVRPEAYLVASLRSPATSPLPAGEAALFVDGHPAGRAHLDLVRPGEPLTLPLGIDRAVRAVRQVHLETRGEGIIDKDDVNSYTVVIDVANPHRQGVAIDVVDQIPQARDDSVEAKLESSTPGAKVDEHGTIMWQTGLAAGATAQFRFVYRLKRPQGHRLHQ